MSLDLDQLEADAKGIKFGTRSSDTILALISELRQARELTIFAVKESDEHFKEREALEDRIRSAEEALEYYARVSPEHGQPAYAFYSRTARAHFERFKEEE